LGRLRPNCCQRHKDAEDHSPSEEPEDLTNSQFVNSHPMETANSPRSLG
jgi:hypothetical protein